MDNFEDFVLENVNFEGHFQAARLTYEEFKLIEQWSRCHVVPRFLMANSQENNPDTAVGSRTIHNARAKIKKDRTQKRNTVEEVLHMCSNLGYTYFWRNCDESTVFSDIVFAHPTSIQMLNTWSYVLVLDTTYKTNNKIHSKTKSLISVIKTSLEYSRLKEKDNAKSDPVLTDICGKNKTGSFGVSRLHYKTSKRSWQLKHNEEEEIKSFQDQGIEDLEDLCLSYGYAKGLIGAWDQDTSESEGDEEGSICFMAMVNEVQSSPSNFFNLIDDNFDVDPSSMLIEIPARCACRDLVHHALVNGSSLPPPASSCKDQNSNEHITWSIVLLSSNHAETRF
ncbi:hypothetical protein M9H77_08024 [Catharanthus roseus]|uniref:Uncharacterized protein n=1 Tax=Catharanthus roseus TaxID=4058 RepID=A0ACC0BWK8_CATRO|nr:hypothetical protein M9H77_08024 [Catharanthus roseus]